MRVLTISLIVFFYLAIVGCKPTKTDESKVPVPWTVDSQKDWEDAFGTNENAKVKEGMVYPSKSAIVLSSTLKKFEDKTALSSITLEQGPQWNSWVAVSKITPAEAEDAPVFIPISKGNYWLLARHQAHESDGYHAWHSGDMQTWTHHGLVSSLPHKWVTSAEYVDGKFYIYFDYPNDEDPHLLIDEDLTDGKQGEVIGMVFDDPSHGSDMSIFRDDDGTFHLIYEDWSPLNPRKHSWDSPLAGHADSPDGIKGFEPHEFTPPIDERSTPTGKMVTYEPHSNQLIEGKDLSPYEYEVHEGPQDAYGDYTTIKIGKQYYIFCDYDPHQEDKSMRVGRWRSDDITKQFVWDGEVGEGFHPDPTVGFAEGRFYLLVQRNEQDFVSDGPWVDGVEVRVGIDTNDDGSVDKWSEFTKIKEEYVQKEGFVRVIETVPAALNLEDLPAGYGFQVEFKLTSKQDFLPILDAFEVTFKAM